MKRAKGRWGGRLVGVIEMFCPELQLPGCRPIAGGLLLSNVLLYHTAVTCPDP